MGVELTLAHESARGVRWKGWRWREEADKESKTLGRRWGKRGRRKCEKVGSSRDAARGTKETRPPHVCLARSTGTLSP